ncbi:MAG: hypothetical protein ACPGWR_15865 [Ardenticatenaceae bacterium]
MTTLEKVRRLEQYIAVDQSAIHPVLEMTIDKLLTRETKRLLDLKTRLMKLLQEFEERYGWKSDFFYTRYEDGQIGDEMDFIEWSATIEMLANSERRLALLKGE